MCPKRNQEHVCALDWAFNLYYGCQGRKDTWTPTGGSFARADQEHEGGLWNISTETKVVT